MFHHDVFFIKKKKGSKIIQTQFIPLCFAASEKSYLKMKEYFGTDLDVKFCAINNLHLRGFTSKY